MIRVTKGASRSTTPASTTIGKPSESKAPMKILVTGGAGFIGSAFVRLVIAETAWEVVNLDKLTYAGNLENLVEVEASDRYRFVHGDITDAAAVNVPVAESKPDAIDRK